MQMTDEGAPLIDWGHVIESLNKVRAHVPVSYLLGLYCMAINVVV